MKVKCQPIQLFAERLLVGAGLFQEDARIAASILIAASLDGIDTHGLSRLPIYLSRIQSGRICARPNVEVTFTGPSTANVDGGNGLGQVVAYQSMEVAVDMAKKAGVGCVAVKSSNHFGASSYFCEMAAKKRMVGIAFTNTPPGIPPYGGKKSYFGTNPIAFAFPTNEQPIVVDMSSSIVARGNIIAAAKEGKEIPGGWAIDEDGNPTTNAQKALAGAVLPMAGPKGYALALAVEVIAGVISGSAVGSNVGWIYDEKTDPANVGHFFVAVDIERFLPYSYYLERIQGMIDEIKAVPLAQGVDEILIPGERRKKIASQRMEEGIEVPTVLLAELNEFAAKFAVKPLQ